MALAAFGLVFGSFGNVVIWRFPRGESLSHPDSHCPVCETPIIWRDNIPVLSWLLLRGKCRACGVRISVRYPVVELMSGVLWVLAGLRFGMTVQTGFAIAFFYLLLLLTWIDLDTMRLPNALVGLLAIIGLAGAILTQLTGIPATPLIGDSVLGLTSPLLMAVAGALVCALPALLLSMIMAAILKRPALGMGDVKLLGVLGIFLGGYGLMAFFVGSVLGAVYGVASASRSSDAEHGAPSTEAEDSEPVQTAESNESGQELDVELPSRKGSPFPFGPALAAGAVIVTLAGPQLWVWYQSLFV